MYNYCISAKNYEG